MISGYYFITDSTLGRGGANDVKQAIAAKVAAVQYRNKNFSSREMLMEALELRKLCRKTIFLINDRVDIALAVDADGVHLGQDDLPCRAARRLLGKNKIIGLTVHSVEEAIAAQEMGADYIGVSPIFATLTKADAGKSIGIKGLKKIREQVSIPIVAIGGINLSNALEVIQAGADAVCAISAVITKPDVCAEIKKFQALFGIKERTLS
ncbi:MAG TPA: thiamine phosphate synthase [Candidatus Omnitrophota bacterium]|nr:thiamine phosphate synthase [Candidatus Omnitrophota bacterium]